jgi:hypothetical protein
MNTTPENQKLLDLIGAARQGKIALPQFQRNFVWSRDDIIDLLLSIMQGHFIGSFLMLASDTDHLPFAARALQGIEIPDSQLRPNALILDGQQRLTSLNYAFTAPNIPLRWTTHPYRFFLDLKKVAEGDLEKAITSYRWIDCGNMLDRTKQFETLIIPLTELENWNAWQNAYEVWLLERDKEYFVGTYFSQIRPAWTELMQQRLPGFQVPTITIPKIEQDDSSALAEVCAIFEKINSTGVKLSVYDLLTARLYKDKIDLHHLWEQAVAEHHLLDLYSDSVADEFGVYTLRTVALMRGLDVKSKTLINLSPKSFEEDWKTAVAYMEKALHRMTSIGKDGFGAFDRKWMPYVTMVTPLAAILYAIDCNKLGHTAYKIMQRWYWSSVFREHYGGAVESAINRDYLDFLTACKDPSFEPEAIREARTGIVENPAFTLKSVSRLNSVYRGIICLVALRGARDFSLNDSIQFHELEDHHVFPANYLSKLASHDGRKLTNDQINCVVNRSLISEATNKKISNKAPSKYLAELIPENERGEILHTQFIESAAQAAMQSDDYEAFLTARDRVLISEMSRRISI